MSTLRCVSMAPLGKPVVPEVYWMLTTSCGLTAAARRSRSASLTADARARNSGHDHIPGRFADLILITRRSLGHLLDASSPHPHVASSGHTLASKSKYCVVLN